MMMMVMMKIKNNVSLRMEVIIVSMMIIIITAVYTKPQWYCLLFTSIFLVKRFLSSIRQFAMAKFGHYVYVEPGRFVYKQGIRDYIQASRKHGVLFGGRQLKHSSFVVTNPHMYTFLMVSVVTLQATNVYIPHCG